MANILRRPMFRLGGQPSDGVGITSGLNRRNYNYGSKYLGQLDEMYDASNKALENYGKVGTPELMLTLSDVIRQGGSISDMIGNATSAVLPMAANYQKAQSMIPSMKFKNLATMAELGIKSDVANKETATAMKERLGMEALELDLTQPGNQEKFDLWMRIAKGTGHVTRDEALRTATEIFYKNDELVENTPKSKHQDMIKQIAESFFTRKFATGGRVGLQNSFPGTVEEASMAEQIQTPGGVEDITENEEVIAEGQEMGGPKQDPFVILRARLPKEITDDVVKLIAYNPDAFKDFAAIETQQDVINFNETYGVELVLPTEQV